jgi:2-amino-4-hydroxy-6-hydroxymethyldihydropteridine diphosphokinase
MQKTVLSLGSNLGDRNFYLAEAIRLIGDRAGIIMEKSSVYETESWGFDAPPFLNQVIVVETSLSPWQLLETLQDIEKQLGRTQKSKTVHKKTTYHNRTLDIDILLYGNQKINSDELTIPHPLIPQRDFIKVPLNELKINY